ncbi:oxidoreductase [Mycobacteroides sp. H001]|uniref:oxidoreductase n=1 Tax=Mycobacteroides TaxID=670516 RepID=UPI000714FADC|nr:MULTISPECIES: oxidoreductase [Mycobacteroides]KRQ28921.1 oxidoreductase [Mycobacteroides sp. H072]KRQ38616.1 oxidoreductase [Mycobacteroides sp. H002]KRQ48958.1 oxidoreductase [Mycobacteroides sp. H054]KRQ71593.1 oxidoreductase [Mycobacteroides sp. H001]OHU36833.1 oxidoreductase [Mycobacteroides chelonae]
MRIAEQTPLNSGFSETTTASEVVGTQDLSGMTAVVTGGYAGLGLEITKALTAAGARVHVPARRTEVAAAALAGTPRTYIDHMDLADLASVNRYSESLRSEGNHIDLLINNAGLMGCPLTRVGAGWESQFVVNHLGHYLLVNRLWPLLTGGARVVAVSSAGHHFAPIQWHDIHFQNNPYDKWVAYGQAKTAVALFAVHLDALGREDGVRAFSVHPGSAPTELSRHLEQSDFDLLMGMYQTGELSGQIFKTPEQGAATALWVGLSPQLIGWGGLYCEDCDIAAPAPPDGRFVGVREYARDPEQAQRLWSHSAETTQIDAFA